MRKKLVGILVAVAVLSTDTRWTWNRQWAHRRHPVPLTFVTQPLTTVGKSMSSQNIGRRILRRAAAPAAALALAIGLSVVVATPGAASGSYTGRAYVYGDGSLTGDWNDEGVVNVATHRSSNVTCLWQTILWADGYLPRSSIDGIFGDVTHAATVRWQRSHGLTADGSVGRATFAKAQQKVVNQDIEGGYRYGMYGGSNALFAVRRPTTAGNWMFASPSGGFISAAYNWKTC